MILSKTWIVVIAIILTIVILMVVLWLIQKNKKIEKEEKNTDVLDSEKVEKFFSYPERQGYNDLRDGSIQMDESRPASMAIIYKSEMDYISRCIHDYPNIETGGQLFGFVTEYGAPVVCYAIGPGPRANHQPAFFNQDVEYLQNTYNELNRRYGLRYIGEWHSHHQLGLAKPSGHDASTVVYGIQKNKFRHFLLCIGNCDNNRHSTLNAFTFHLEDPYNYYHAPWKIVEMESPYRPIIDREMRDVLIHPRTQQASYGTNYVLNERGATSFVTPNYTDEYWLNQKANNIVLKNIIDFLTNYENGSVVKPMLDGQKHVHLTVQRANRQEQIVFGDRFPNEAPIINVQEGTRVNNSIEWQYTGDIFDSFVRYYKEFFNKKDYHDEYWLNQKANNIVLKNIIEFLTNYENGSVVKPMLDGQKHVHLTVQRANRQEQIVFGDRFPNEAPEIRVSEGVIVNNSVEWQFNGEIYKSFVQYYDDFFKKGMTGPKAFRINTDGSKTEIDVSDNGTDNPMDINS